MNCWPVEKINRSLLKKSESFSKQRIASLANRKKAQELNIIEKCAHKLQNCRLLI